MSNINLNVRISALATETASALVSEYRLSTMVGEMMDNGETEGLANLMERHAKVARNLRYLINHAKELGVFAEVRKLVDSKVNW